MPVIDAEQTTGVRCTLPVRIHDAWGNGEYGAKRGDRTHKGIDLAAYPFTIIQSMTPGRVSKLGHVYASDLRYRYVQITLGERDYRYFYVQPLVKVGEWVWTGTVIGRVQDIAGKYTTKEKVMINHMHFSIKHNGVHLDPTTFIIGDPSV